MCEFATSSAHAEAVVEASDDDESSDPVEDDVSDVVGGEVEAVEEDIIEDEVDNNGQLTKRTIKGKGDNGNLVTVIEYSGPFPSKKTVTRNGTVIEETTYKIAKPQQGFIVTTNLPLENKTIMLQPKSRQFLFSFMPQRL